MLYVWKKKDIMQIRALIMGMMGAVAGVVFFVLFRKNVVESLETDYVQNLLQLQNMEIDCVALLYHIGRVRMMQMTVLFLCYTCKKRKCCMYLYLAIVTSVVAIQMLSLFYLYGVKGFAVFFLLQFPQGLVYLLIFCFLLYKSENKGKDYTCHKIIGKGNRVVHLLGCLMEGVLLLASCILGILMECYANTLVIQRFLQYLM